MPSIIRLAAIAATIFLTACAGSSGANRALVDSKSAVQANSHTFAAPPDATLRVVTGTLVRKGFAIEQADPAMGLVKAVRNLSDPKDPNTNYHVSATAYVVAGPDARGSVVSLAASQQTVLYRKGHTWTMLPLLPIIPIPTGRKYETVVTGEGSILDGTFYADFFAAVDQALASAATAPTRAALAVAAAPVPAAPAAVAATAEPAARAVADSAPLVDSPPASTPQ